ncbi:MAG: peptidoglycan DD-metalloendopeptidase family protein [Bacteroidota bacterium]|uniref:Peptidoglycan DD-metalloendopeptidase family protein n=1 Tax=Flagellimonas profundi TaxID=2915620 RepID=A0ABS3FDU2_9FLAO|nr:peptidoglycan DD-metalloendopeptidase family protein [Allomuricauda profundi]MBO0341329.1 peptidoglycan DD-metalloendopeptidase family protein [Allomuricauda profundi]MEC7771216.1 peptidoglycan DD-metalloendopeptidase family protein [Bacteroidota bacterium]
MYYPLCLNGAKIHPLFGNFLKGEPYIFDFSSNNPKTLEYNLFDFAEFNDMVFNELDGSSHQWGIGRYLEERKTLLRAYPNIIEEKRYYHLGLDIIVPYDTPMFSPLDAEVYKTGKETTVGNYGGYIILKHSVNGVVFFSLYGHLKTPLPVNSGDKIKAGQKFAYIGQESDSGGWFCHVHLQILTQQAIDDGYADWGYISPALLPKVETYFPSPYFLFKY